VKNHYPIISADYIKQCC